MKATRLVAPKKIRADGFTLIELFVVIATVAILAILLLPALAGTKTDSQSFQCLENQRQLVRAWQMYAEDNSDLLPPNDYPFTTPYGFQSAATQATMKNWVVGTMYQPIDLADVPANIGKSELLDPNTLLSPYQTNRAVYRCPADNFVNPAVSPKVHVRSYSMNSAVGTLWYSSSTYGGSSAPALGSPVGGGWLNGNAYNNSQTTWRVYGKMSSFSRPGPANTFVMTEENPYSINDASIAIAAAAATGNTYITDWPAGTQRCGGHILCRWPCNHS
ncbi:MAG: hypothetical protein WAO02_09840 [Verrucomicrobiia bacterium]